jgi:hypothetical protein
MFLWWLLLRVFAVLQTLSVLQEQGTAREVHSRNEMFGSVDGNFAAGSSEHQEKKRQ